MQEEDQAFTSSLECVTKILFSNFSTKTYVVGTQKNCLTHQIWLNFGKKKFEPPTPHGTPNFLGPHPLGPWGGGQKFNLSEHGYVAYQT